MRGRGSVRATAKASADTEVTRASGSCEAADLPEGGLTASGSDI
jgi:hypothetical protein